MRFRLAGDFCIAVARQIYQQAANFLDDGRILAMLADMRAAKREIIDVLCPTRGFRCKREFLLIAQNIKGSRLASVGAAGERDFRNLRIWQIAKMVHRGEETGLPK